MSVRFFLRSRVARFSAVLLIMLAISPVTQPFSTLGVSDFFEETGQATHHDSKAPKDVAAVCAVMMSLVDHALCGDSIRSTRALVIERDNPFVVLRI